MNTNDPLRSLGIAVLAAFFLPHLGAQEMAPPPGTVTGGATMAATAPAANFVPSRMITMRPDEKRPLLLKQDERNPYAKRGPGAVEEVEREADAEELRIRAHLSTLRVTGRSRGPNGLRILLGDIILEEGRPLPQLLRDQSESLRVVELNEDTVVLGWLDLETGALTGKTMQVAYDLTPSVGYALQGQPVDAGTEEGSRPMGVLRVSEDRKRTDPGMAAREESTPLPPED